MRLSDGTHPSPGPIRFNVDVFEGGVKVREASIVRQTYFPGNQRILWDEDGRAYVPRHVGLGVEEVELADG